MIGWLSGVLRDADNERILVETQGVGYEVRIPTSLRQQLPTLGETISLYIRTLFSEEDGILLYGFPNPWQRRLFDLLITVSGVGPKLALNLMSATEPETLARAIALKDTRMLRTLPGVGAKLAERLVLELSDKVAELAFEQRVERLKAVSRAAEMDLDALLAGLVQLGYSRRDASSALQAALQENPDADEQTLMRLALAKLAPRR
ncbi:Holliday junction ATP-dependent DNA helicase RuvA [bacterium HR15]|nr:Holliday junction ATP-dependent DNA helicase RuvA [bacterium HR15]